MTEDQEARQNPISVGTGLGIFLQIKMARWDARSRSSIQTALWLYQVVVRVESLMNQNDAGIFSLYEHALHELSLGLA